MISEEEVELLVERLVDRVETANTYFLTKIGESIRKIRDLTPTQAQQLVQILKYGGNYEEIVREIARITNLNIEDIDEMFREYAKRDQLFYEKFYSYRNIPFVEYSQNLALKRQTEAIANLYKNELYNFTRENVLGYTIRDLDGKVQFYGLRDTYNRVLEEALLNVSQGKETFDEAMTRTLKEIGGSGLKKIDFKSGRSVRLDSMFRQHLKEGLRTLHNENQRLFGEEFGYDGWEISVHPFPADDHAKVQGRQFSIEEYNKLQNGLSAKDYKGRSYTLDHNHDAKHRPISTLNCYHKAFAIVLGVSKPEYTDEQLEAIIKENEKGFEFEGKHYSMYDGEQLLRKIELELRKSKDIQIMGRASGNKQLVENAQNRITQLTSKYRDVLKASGLKSKLDRARVQNYHRINVDKMK